MKSVLKFAGNRVLPKLGNAAKDILKVVKPDLSTGEGIVDALTRYGPDFAFPLLLTANIPEGTSALDRGLAYGEDLGLGLMGSVLGQYGGRKLGGLAMASGAGAGVARGLQTLGDITGGFGQAFLPRTQVNRIFNEAGMEEQAIREAEIRQEEQEKMQAIVNALIAGGGTAAGYALRPQIRTVL